MYFSHLDLSEYDVVISITGAEAKYVKTGSQTKHISYIHAPTQYYWGKYDQYLSQPGFGILNPLMRFGLKALVGPLRRADYRFAQKPDVLIANSTFVQQEIKQYYNRDSIVVFPPVSVVDTTLKTKRDGFVIIGRQSNWKRIDLAIESVKQTGDKLTIIGDGAEHAALVKLADGAKNIKFKAPVYDDKKKSEILASAKGFIFTSQEPFGIAPVEALMTGTPVIALQDGGALDFVIDGKNGVFFNEQTIESLKAAIIRFDLIKFSLAEVKKSAAKFSDANFKKQIKELVD
jgi:glycosyltransferase involved in cell wall biosynthesis